MSARSTIYMAEDAFVVMCDTTANILAVRQSGHTEIWSANGETHMGNLPLNATTRDIHTVVDFWHRGFVEGVSFGRDEAQASLRAALGLGK